MTQGKIKIGAEEVRFEMLFIDSDQAMTSVGTGLGGGKILVHAIQRDIVPHEGELHPAVIAACEEVFAHECQLTENKKRIKQIQDALPDMRVNEMEMNQRLQEAIWEQVPDQAGLLEKRVFRGKGEGDYLIDKNGDRISYDIPPEKGEELIQQSEQLTHLQVAIAKAEQELTRRKHLLHGQESSGRPMRKTMVEHLLHGHHLDVAERFVKVEKNPDSGVLTFFVYEEVSDEKCIQEMAIILQRMDDNNGGSNLLPSMRRLVDSLAEKYYQAESLKTPVEEASSMDHSKSNKPKSRDKKSKKK